MSQAEMFTRTSGRSAGTSGGGSTAAITSGSVSQIAITPVDQISGRLERSSEDFFRLSAGRAPYRMRATYLTSSAFFAGLRGVGSGSWTLRDSGVVVGPDQAPVSARSGPTCDVCNTVTP